MTKMQTNPILAFVWRPVEINPAVVDMAGRTSSLALFDISADRTENLAEPLKAAGATDVKISAEHFMDPALEDFLQDAHEMEERYSVRDGINIARYALKRLVEKGERLTSEERKARVVDYMKEAASMILDENAARYFAESLDVDDDDDEEE